MDLFGFAIQRDEEAGAEFAGVLFCWMNAMAFLASALMSPADWRMRSRALESAASSVAGSTVALRGGSGHGVASRPQHFTSLREVGAAGRCA